MTKTFSNIDPIKQKRIIDVSLEEFANQGYEQASTNRMVKAARIGKGMLFYYFKSKQDLYYFLINYSLDFILNHYLALIDEHEPDFIKRYKQASQIKMKTSAENPHIFNFMGMVILNEDNDLPHALQSRLTELKQLGYTKLYDNIDYTLFRDDMDTEKIFKLMRWSIEGYEKELMQRLKGEQLSKIDFKPFWDEFHNYLEILNKCFYKQVIKKE